MNWFDKLIICSTKKKTLNFSASFFAYCCAFLSETWLKRVRGLRGKTSGACGNLSVRNGNMSVIRLSVKNGNLSVRKRFSPDKLYFWTYLSVRRRGPTDKICPIGKLLSGLTFHLSVLMRVVVSVSAVTSWRVVSGSVLLPISFQYVFGAPCKILSISDLTIFRVT